MISLALGSPEVTLLPADRLRQAWEAALRRAGTEVMGCSPVVHGSTQGLDLLLRLLTRPGDAVVTEVPTYFGALVAFQAHGLRLLGVPVDRDGMVVDQVELLLARYRPRLIYTVPTYQNPTGTVMSLERRERLLSLAVRYQVPIVEDDPFSELSFGSAPPPPIKALERSGHVFHVGTFSKTLSPGLRLGWIVAARPVVELAVLLKRVTDMQPAAPSQYLVAEFLQRGWLDEHLAVVRDVYASRCRVMDGALRRYLPQGARWSVPGGGMFIWLELPQEVAAEDLLEETSKNGMVFLPGRALYLANPPRHLCRLNFTVPDEQAIRRGVAVMGAALRQVMRRRPSAPSTPAAAAIV